MYRVALYTIGLCIGMIYVCLYAFFPVTEVRVLQAYVIAGQSNASGYAERMMPYSGDSLMLWKNGQWYPLMDPVSLTSHRGSVWPLVASALPYSVGFVPSASPGTVIAEWLPGTPLFEQLQQRSVGAHLILWWQGENDAWHDTPSTEYEESLNRLANALDVPLMPALIQQSPLWDNTAVNQAIARVIASNPNVVAGPDLSHLMADDEHHLMSYENLSAAALLWAERIESYG